MKKSIYLLYRKEIIGTGYRGTCDFLTFAKLLELSGVEIFISNIGYQYSQEVSTPKIEKILDQFKQKSLIGRLKIIYQAKKLEPEGESDMKNLGWTVLFFTMVFGSMFYLGSAKAQDYQPNPFGQVLRMQEEFNRQELLRLQVEKARYMNGNGGALPMRQNQIIIQEYQPKANPFVEPDLGNSF